MTNFAALSDYDQAMLEDYERCLRNGKKLSKTYFSGCSDTVKQNRAILLFKYFFEKIVCWNPHQIINFVSEDVVENKAMLARAYSALTFPPDFSKKDYFYLANLCYPDETSSMFKDEGVIILQYNKVLQTGCPFPKRYFDTPDGTDKARIMMQQALLHSTKRFDDEEDLYGYFAKKKNGDEFLSKAKLKHVCANNFSSPLEFMHYSLAPQQRNDFLFNYYKIDSLCKQNHIKI